MSILYILFLEILMILGKEVFSFLYSIWLFLNIYQGYQHVRGILTKNGCKNKSLVSRLEENSQSLVTAILLPVAKDTVIREKEDNGVEAEEELGIFQLLDRLEEVTSMLTSRWQESTVSMVLSLLFYPLFSLYNY